MPVYPKLCGAFDEKNMFWTIKGEGLPIFSVPKHTPSSSDGLQPHSTANLSGAIQHIQRLGHERLRAHLGKLEICATC